MKSKKLYLNIKLFTLGVFSLTAINSYSVNYNIAFTGTGATSNVGSVIVENTTQKTSVTVPGGNTLNLTNVITAIQQVGTANDEMTFKSDLQGISTVSFIAKQAGQVQFNVYGIDGRKMVGMSHQALAGQCNYSLTLPKGMYVLQVQGNAFAYSTKLNVANSVNNKTQLSYIGTESSSAKSSKVKSSAQGVTQMLYTAGDQLIFKGYSGNYATFVSSVPSDDATVNFNFVDCTDADGNHYATVAIGSQLWMAENLKTTKFSDGTLVPLHRPYYDTNPSCYYYKYDPSKFEEYGLLYTWYTVDPNSNGNKSITPTGWHVPSLDEVNALISQVGNDNVWNQMRTTDWTGNNASNADNATGFSVKQAGYLFCVEDDRNGSSGELTSFWTTDVDPGNNPQTFVFHSNFPNSHTNSFTRSYYSFPIRCVKD